MHDRRGLQSVAAALRTHVVASQAPQFVVYQRGQSFQRLRMARSPLGEQLGEIGRDLHRRFLTPTEEPHRPDQAFPQAYIVTEA